MLFGLMDMEMYTMLVLNVLTACLRLILYPILHAIVSNCS